MRIARRALQIDLSNRCVVEIVVSKCNIDNIFGVLEDVVVVLVLSVEQNNTKTTRAKKIKTSRIFGFMLIVRIGFASSVLVP